MRRLTDIISNEISLAFERLGFDQKYAIATVSNRPDLCEFQCNGAMALAKQMGRKPIEIAEMISGELSKSDILGEVTVAQPGFVNINVEQVYLASYLREMSRDVYRFGCEKLANTKTIIIDYGGPNVAKPLHVGHLRSAVIGEAIKRMGIFMGNTMIGDVHLGDWGMPMGLIIAELSIRKPELIYFNQAYTGEYPREAPFTISELEEIYPAASAKSKTDEKFKNKAMRATKELQQGRNGYIALWKQIVKVSVADLKKSYKRLNVSFELWKGESDVDSYIPEMVRKMKDDGISYESDGAIVVDVKEDTDSKEVPPCIILKSDGAALYQTTDLATIIQRTNNYMPDDIIYVVDKRQEMHFTQVFRTARKAELLPDTTGLYFLGFGTMNGKDGKPFKTREGGVMRLSDLLDEIENKMFLRVSENPEISEEEAHDIAAKIAVSAIKYGDLSNQASKDYIFDIDKFTSFEGDTGPYILYTIVRIKSILDKYTKAGGAVDDVLILSPKSEQEKKLMLSLVMFNGVVESAYAELAPHRICSYIYELSNTFNRFYHETKILTESDLATRKGYISLINLTLGILEKCIDILGFEAPDRM